MKFEHGKTYETVIHKTGYVCNDTTRMVFIDTLPNTNETVHRFLINNEVVELSRFNLIWPIREVV